MTSPPSESDELAVLLTKIADADEAAYAQFYDRTSSRVFGMVLRVLRDRGFAEETTQEVYLQVWRNAGNYSAREGSPMGWLIAIAHRRAVDRVRSETASARREDVYGAGQFMVDGDRVDEQVEDREEAGQVRRCLATLTERQAEAVGLAYYGGLTYREVAEKLGVALPTVKSRIRDGLLRLRGCLNGG
ncbi:MAG: ECF RNA polymerase sigma factor SigK [Gordonia sp. (in: high G+C Gram-positive bacteria)]